MNRRTTCGVQALARMVILFGTSLATAALYAQPPDVSGTWLPVPSMAETWDIAALPLSEAALEKLDAFDSQRLDSTFFCMPFGTPRNTLNTAPRPLEIIQTDRQITIIFDGLGDVRRIFLDGQKHPDDPIPNWMGHSVGSWDNGILTIETIAMTGESILTDDGLPHSEAAMLTEEIQLVSVDGESMLKNEMRLIDPEYYLQPLTATRYFRNAPDANLSEGSSTCLLQQWRTALEEMNREMFREMQQASGDTQL